MADTDTPEVKPEELLGTPRTEDYYPSAYPAFFTFQRQRPLFTPTSISMMLTDARIQYGLALIIGPIISMTSLEIESDDADFVEFANRQYKRFWNTSVARVLSSIPWGYSGSEVMYREEDGKIEFDIVRDLKPNDVRAVVYRGELVGLTVKNIRNQYSPEKKMFLGGPKCLWNVHNRGHNLYYGLSHLYGCFVPWWETWSEGGYRDMRRLWYYKNCFQSARIRHPQGTFKLPSGQLVANKDLAREIVEKMRSGAVIALSSMKDANGDYLWVIEDAVANPAPEGLEGYGESLRFEIFEGMSIPEEIVRSEGQGLGTGEGRSIPLLAFLAWLQTIAQWIVFDFDNQILRPLSRINYSDGLKYTVNVKRLIDTIINDQNDPLADEGEGAEGEVDEFGNTLPPDKDGGTENIPPSKSKAGSAKKQLPNGKPKKPAPAL